MRHDDNDYFFSFCSFQLWIYKKKIIDGNESDSHHYLINERNYREFQDKKEVMVCELMGIGWN